MAIQRGEIYFVNLNPVQGREQAEPRLCWCSLLESSAGGDHETNASLRKRLREK